MENKHYSKVWTQFETQSMAFVKLRMAFSLPKYLIRGYDGYLVIYHATSDHQNPDEVLKIHVRASSSKDECGFFKKSDNEYLLIGGDVAWNVVDHVKTLLS